MKLRRHEYISIALLGAYIISLLCFYAFFYEEDNIFEHAPQSAIPYYININTADADELISLDGIGPKTADAIIKFRESCGGFKTVDDLCGVPGIGVSTLNKIKSYIRV